MSKIINITSYPTLIYYLLNQSVGNIGEGPGTASDLYLLAYLHTAM